MRNLIFLFLFSCSAGDVVRFAKGGAGELLHLPSHENDKLDGIYHMVKAQGMLVETMNLTMKSIHIDVESRLTVLERIVKKWPQRYDELSKYLENRQSYRTRSFEHEREDGNQLEGRDYSLPSSLVDVDGEWEDSGTFVSDET